MMWLTLLLDEATKMAEVLWKYAKSFYGGAANANTKLAGEVIGILAGPNRRSKKWIKCCNTSNRKWSMFL